MPNRLIIGADLSEGSPLGSLFLWPPVRIRDMEKINVCYFQSGGPTSVINTSLYGALMAAKRHADSIGEFYGSIDGVEGLIEDRLLPFSTVSKETVDLLPQTPGVFLGSSRRKLHEDQETWSKIKKTVQKHNISLILVNGGNDSMDTCSKLASHLNVKVVGIPKTIDNDLALTDHCPGFGSAAKHVINQVKLISIDAHSYSSGKVVIIEVMGREAGWLAASADLLPYPYHPDLIYLPEGEFSEEEFLAEVKANHEKKGTCVVVVSEGIPIHHETLALYDSFGHASPEGAALELGKLVNKKLGLGVRTVILSTPVRANPFLISKTDSQEASALGQAALEAGLEGRTGIMIALERVSSHPYQCRIKEVPVNKVANENRLFPKEWILSPHSLSAEFHDYLEPLVQGHIDVKMDEDGCFLASSLYDCRK